MNSNGPAMLDDSRYRIADSGLIFSPALVLFREILDENLDEMIRIAGHAVSAAAALQDAQDARHHQDRAGQRNRQA